MIWRGEKDSLRYIALYGKANKEGDIPGKRLERERERRIMELKKSR